MARHEPTAPDLSLKQPIIISIDLPETALPPPAEGRVDLLDFTDAGLRVKLPSGKISSLTLPPMMLVGIAAGEPGSGRVKRVIEWLEKKGAKLPPVVAWRRGTEAEALTVIAQSLGHLVSQGTARRARTTQEVMRLRKANGELQYRFAVAEDALFRSGANPHDLAFVNDPASDVAQHVLLSETEAGIAQVLPVGSNGVAGIGIHFGSMSESWSGTLMAQLSTLEDGRIIERWVVPVDRMVEGWNILGLNRTISGLDRTLELLLTRQSAEERLPPVSLGSGQALIAYQIRDVASGQPALRNSLALQIWKGLPGTRNPTQANVHMPQRRSSAVGGFRDIPFNPAAIVAAEHVNPDQVQFDFPAVVGPPGERAVMCHAPVHGLTLGRLGGTIPDEAIRISASAFIDNQQSKDVDFALIVANSVQRAKAIGEGQADPSEAEAFSGWSSVRNGQVKRLSALREAPGADAQLFVATRMTVAGDNSYARARFKDFSVMVQA